MRTKQGILGLLTLASIAFMGFLLHYSNTDNSACDKNCPIQQKEKNQEQHTGGSPDEPSITHMIASV